MIAPLVPVTVMATEAAATALAAAVKVRVLVPLPPATVAGLKLAVTPVGRPLTLRLTSPVNPFTGSTRTDVVPVPPSFSTLVPLAETLKDGAVVAGTGGKAFWMFWMNSAAKN